MKNFNCLLIFKESIDLRNTIWKIDISRTKL